MVQWIGKKFGNSDPNALRLMQVQLRWIQCRSALVNTKCFGRIISYGTQYICAKLRVIVLRRSSLSLYIFF